MSPVAFFTAYRAGVREILLRRKLSRGRARILSIIAVLAALVWAIILAILDRAMIWAILLFGVGVWPWPVEISHI